MMDLIRGLENHERFRPTFSKGELVLDGNKIKLTLPVRPTPMAKLERVQTDPAKAIKAMAQKSNALRVADEFEYWNSQLDALAKLARGVALFLIWVAPTTRIAI